MKKWNVFVQSSSTKKFYCLVNAYSFDEAINIARMFFPKLNVTGAQRIT